MFVTVKPQLTCCLNTNFLNLDDFLEGLSQIIRIIEVKLYI